MTSARSGIPTPAQHARAMAKATKHLEAAVAPLERHAAR